MIWEAEERRAQFNRVKITDYTGFKIMGITMITRLLKPSHSRTNECNFNHLLRKFFNLFFTHLKLCIAVAPAINSYK